MIINDLDDYYIVFDTKNRNTELDTLYIKWSIDIKGFGNTWYYKLSGNLFDFSAHCRQRKRHLETIWQSECYKSIIFTPQYHSYWRVKAMLLRCNNYDIALRMLRYRILKALLDVFCSVFLLLVIAFFFLQTNIFWT